MAMGVVLQDERGEIVERVLDLQDLLPRLLPDIGSEGYCFLNCIDRYGDTIFNRLQAPRFLSEWERVEARVGSAYERELCNSIRSLFEKVEADMHLYVRFIGD
jgi:hypothetical protein